MTTLRGHRRRLVGGGDEVFQFSGLAEVQERLGEDIGGPDGFVVTKASRLQGVLMCRLRGGKTVAAEIT